jgi:CBS domain-containing protein
MSQVAQLDLRAILSGTQVQELVLTQVPLVTRDEPLSAAAAAMRGVRHGSALVCENGKLIGIVTERDVLRAVGDAEKWNSPVGAAMTARPKTLALDDSLLDAVQWMNRGGYRRLPVVDAQGRPAGLVDVKTVVNFLVDHMSSTVYTQASRKMLTVQECEGA